MISLLGRRDVPTDALEEYSKRLGCALARRGTTLDLVRVPWAEQGWSEALRWLRAESAAWEGRWVLVQYTSLSWSSRGFPLRFLSVLRILKRARSRVAIVFHDPVGHLGKRLVDRIRCAVQIWAMRRAYRLADCAVFPIPVERASWLPRNPAKAVFIPVGSNIPIPEGAIVSSNGLGSMEGAGTTVAVFGITPDERQTKQISAIAESLRQSAPRVPGLKLIAFGRGTREAEGALRGALAGTGVEVSVLGLLPAEGVSQVLSQADALLDVRDTVSSRRSTLITAIGCGLPVVGYHGFATDQGIASAGVRLVPEGDVAALGKNLQEVLTNRELRQSLRERSRSAYRESYTWDSIAEQWVLRLGREVDGQREENATRPDRFSVRSDAEGHTGGDVHKHRLLVVATHPVQYGSPLFRRMAGDGRIDLLVAYCSLQGSEPGLDPEFQREVSWDVPLLDGYRWVQVPNRSSAPGLGRFWGLRNPGLWGLIRNGGFDAVVLTTGYVYASFWIALAAAKASGTPVLFGTDSHELGSRRERNWKRLVKKAIWPIVFRIPDVVIVPSSGGVRLMRSLGIPGSRVVLTPYAVDNDWWVEQAQRVRRQDVRARWGVPDAARVVLFCGKLQPWKRPGDLLAAAARVQAPEAYVVFAGEGPLRLELEEEARALGIAEQVRFLGFANQSELPAIYRASDVLVLPSEHEPFGLVVNEAMLCGCAVVVSDRVGAQFDLIRPGETGSVYPCGDVDALAGILDGLLRSEEELRIQGESGRARMTTWSFRENVDALLGAVEQARGRSKAAAPEVAS